jgi:hypothetical protein
MSTSVLEINDIREIKDGREINGGGEINDGSTRPVSVAWQAGRKETWWSQHRETSLNWLAFGVLLAAWNAADDGTAASGAAPRRPQALRGYSSVSVRAVTLHSAQSFHARVTKA